MFPLNEHGLRLPIETVWSSILETVTTQLDSLEHPALVGPALDMDGHREISRLPFHLNWSDSDGLQQIYSGGRFKKNNQPKKKTHNCPCCQITDDNLTDEFSFPLRRRLFWKFKGYSIKIAALYFPKNAQPC